MILRFIKFIFNDIKQDLKTISKLLSKDQAAIESSRRIFTYLREHFWEILRDNWYWYLLLLAAFGIGWGFAGSHYSNKCNAILVERGCFMIQQYMVGL